MVIHLEQRYEIFFFREKKKPFIQIDGYFFGMNSRQNYRLA
jgi:hypothetical protein